MFRNNQGVVIRVLTTVEMGKVIGHIISLNQVLDLAEKGFRKDLTEGAITLLLQDISKQMAGFSFSDKASVVDDYQENSDWVQFVYESPRTYSR